VYLPRHGLYPDSLKVHNRSECRDQSMGNLEVMEWWYRQPSG